MFLRVILLAANNYQAWDLSALHPKKHIRAATDLGLLA